MFNCFAYSSSGTPNFLAIATCDGVSLTVLRPDLVLRFAEATVCTGLVVSFSAVSLLLANFMRKFPNEFFCLFQHNIRHLRDHNLLLQLTFYVDQMQCKSSHYPYQTKSFSHSMLRLLDLAFL